MHDADWRVRLRDLGALATFEAENPVLFARMYNVWCRKPSA